MENLNEEPHRESIFEVSKSIRKQKESTVVSRLLYIGSINIEERRQKFDLGAETDK